MGKGYGLVWNPTWKNFNIGTFEDSYNLLFHHHQLRPSSDVLMRSYFRTLGCFCGRFHNRLPLTFTSRGQEWAGEANNEQPAPGRRDLAPGRREPGAPGAPGRREPGAPGAPGYSGRDRGSDLVGSSKKAQVSGGSTGNTSQEIFQFLTNSDPIPVLVHSEAWPKTCYYVSL